MTTLSSDTDNGASAGARIYSQVMELEKQLKAQIKEKRAFHPDVRNIRAKLREKYVEIILTDYEVSEKHDIATSLWHFVYYNMIEEFRTRIRYAASAPVPGAKVPTQRVSPQKLLAEFKNFISEATKFYNALILKLKKKYGLSQEDLAFEGPEFDLLASKQLTEVKRSCHRLFIHLGDLARYKELHSDGDNYAPDWNVPASYYYKAVSLWPSTGHPHNQLAVLATYIRNDFLAVYHYFRSLAVDDPFTTARGNLVLLFERNRQQYAELSDQKGLADVQKKRTGKEGRNSSSSASPLKAKIEGKDTESDRKKSFFVRFVRLNGILFTKTSLETFPEVYSDTVRDLEKLLSLDLTTLEGLFISNLQNPVVSVTGLALGALQVVSILMFSVPNGNSRSTYADAVQHSTVSRHALTAAFKIAGCFMSTCAKSKAASGSPLLPASLVFMEWLACRQEMLVGNGAEDDKQSSARTFFWKESLALLNSFCDGDNSLAEPNNHVALWEDHELRGFAPLLPAHLTLDFSRRQPTNEETQVRVQRFVAAGKAVASALDGSGKGLLFDEDMGRFLLAADRRERRSKEKVVLPKAVDKAVDKQVIDLKSNPHPVPQVAEPALVSASSLSLAAVEDEEEVIVFKPLAKGTPVAPEVKQNDLYGSLGISAGVGTEVSDLFKTEVHEGEQSAAASGGSNLDYGSISDSLKNIPMQVPTTAFERPAIPSFVMTSLNASSMPMVNGAGTVSSGYPFSSSNFDGFQARYAGLSYGPSSSTNHQAGVIGQPKENPLASNLMIPQSVAGDVPGHTLAESAGSFNTPSAYPSSLAQDLLYKLQNVTVGKGNPEAPFARQTASGYGISTERVPVVEKVNTELGRPLVSIGDVVKDGSNAVRAGQASVRPPPGFGPIPLRAAGGNKLVSQPAARPLPMDHAMREDNRLLDNAGWLDAYPGGKTAGMPRPLYNTDFGIWSTANNGLPVPKSTSYPFPGMGVRTLQEIEQQQQQSLLQQPSSVQQQALLQQPSSMQQQSLLQQPSSMQQQSLLQQPSSMQQLYGGWKPESGMHGYDAQQLQLQQLQQQQQQQVLQQQLLRQFRPQDPFVS